jgi:hypothetical protein
MNRVYSDATIIARGVDDYISHLIDDGRESATLDVEKDGGDSSSD